MAESETVPTDLLNRKEAANFLRSLRCTVATVRSLAQLAVVGGGPRYFLEGNRAMYSQAELERWRWSRLRPKEPK